MKYEYKDCYCTYKDSFLSIGNGLIERSYRISRYGMEPIAVLDKKNKKTWTRDGAAKCITLPFIAQSFSCDMCTSDNAGLSEEFLCAKVSWHHEKGGKVTRTFSAFPESPFVSTAMEAVDIGVYDPAMPQQLQADGIESAVKASDLAQPDCIDAVPIPMSHYKLRAVVFADKSDQNDALVRNTIRQVYAGGWGGEWDEGNLFLLEDYVRSNGDMLLVKDAPYNMSEQNRLRKDLCIIGGRSMQLVGTGLSGCDTSGGLIGHGSTVGVGRKDELPRLYREFYKKVWAGRKTRIMSNTWGDRSQDSAVCESFMLKEVECAANLGVDTVQIDDGWQHGHTANSKLKKGGVWEGYYKADPHFWTVNTEKFPNGLKPFVDKCHDYGMQAGLWISPDSTEDFARWNRDAETILGLWKNEGIAHFKLDGVNIRSKQGERNYLKLLEAICSGSGNAIGINQDITAQTRLGSIFGKQYGIMYVENRYTDTATYYPHQTLKNLWTLSEWMPAAKMQFECLNPRRNKDKYDPEDPLRPDAYDMDYLFAITMPSSSLIWMEMCHLGSEDTEKLKGIISIYKQQYDRMALCDVCPIGSEPDGLSLTGFRFTDAQGGYFLLFRESTASDTFELDCDPAGMRLLASNTTAAISGEKGKAAVKIGKERGYAFIQYR